MKVKVNTQGTTQVVAVGIQGPAGAGSINAMQDVDTTNMKDGSVLVYSTEIEKWVATNMLEKQVLEGGQF